MKKIRLLKYKKGNKIKKYQNPDGKFNRIQLFDVRDAITDLKHAKDNEEFYANVSVAPASDMVNLGWNSDTIQKYLNGFIKEAKIYDNQISGSGLQHLIEFLYKIADTQRNPDRVEYLIDHLNLIHIPPPPPGCKTCDTPKIDGTHILQALKELKNDISPETTLAIGMAPDSDSYPTTLHAAKEAFMSYPALKYLPNYDLWAPARGYNTKKNTFAPHISAPLTEAEYDALYNERKRFPYPSMGETVIPEYKSYGTQYFPSGEVNLEASVFAEEGYPFLLGQLGTRYTHELYDKDMNKLFDLRIDQEKQRQEQLRQERIERVNQAQRKRKESYDPNSIRFTPEQRQLNQESRQAWLREKEEERKRKLLEEKRQREELKQKVKESLTPAPISFWKSVYDYFTED